LFESLHRTRRGLQREALRRKELTDKEAAERQRYEEQLASLNADLKQRISEFEVLFEVMPVGIGVAYDPLCRRIRANPSFAALLGISPEQNASKTAPEHERPKFRVMDQTGDEIPSDSLPMQVCAREG